MIGPEDEGEPYDKLVNVEIHNWRRRIAKTDPTFRATAAERRAFYGLVLGIPWLAPSVRRAVTRVLRLTTKAERRDFKRWWALTARYRIGAHMERMRKNGERHRWEDAVAKCAAEEGITNTAFKKRLATWPSPWRKGTWPPPKNNRNG